MPSASSSHPMPDQLPTVFLIVGLPGAGKTMRARELATSHRALLLTPDTWMIPLFGREFRSPEWAHKRDVLEGRLISLAMEALRLGVSVVLDFGFWGRDERSALRWIAHEAGVSCEVVYLPVDRHTQLSRIRHRQEHSPAENFLMTEEELDSWRAQFEVPDAAELAGADLPLPPAGCTNWMQWAAERWPGLS